MIVVDITRDMIIEFIKLFVQYMCVFYCFNKISNNCERKCKQYIIIIIANIIMLLIYVVVKKLLNSFLPFFITLFIYSIIIAKLTKNNLGYSIVVTIISYALTFACHIIGVMLQFIPYKLLYRLYNKENLFLNLYIITILQIIIIYLFFKIKRFRNGFSFFKDKLNNDTTDIIMINISTIIIIVYCLFITYQHEITKNLFMTFIVLGITMFFTIKKMFTMYYKQKLLTDTMEEYKKELVDKQNEIDKLKAEKTNISKITHDFYNRQKALELLVASNMNSDNIDKSNVSPNVLNIIESLTNEYAERFENIKELPVLDKTEIPEIDNIFKYMQSECNKNNIDFKLKISGNIHSLINNIIDKNKLETLIGDHLRDAINAVNLITDGNKEIMTILGIKNKKYELSILDTGVDFEIDTLLKLGLERVTTNKDRGGSGIGFMTTFETMKETKASLIITEYPINKDRYYSKCITIRFDGKNQYKICSHRADEIKEHVKDNRIKIEEYKNNK